MLMSCSLCLTETESRIINVQIPVVPPCWIKNQNKVTNATAPIYSYSQNTCQAASPSLPYTHTHAHTHMPVPRESDVYVSICRMFHLTLK